jgi:hypothetical protein
LGEQNRSRNESPFSADLSHQQQREDRQRDEPEKLKSHHQQHQQRIKVNQKSQFLSLECVTNVAEYIPFQTQKN